MPLMAWSSSLLHPEVRNLDWLMRHPGLLAGTPFHKADLFYQPIADIHRWQGWCLQLEEQPARIENYLQQHLAQRLHSKRLGYYAEILATFAWQHADHNGLHAQLVRHNCLVRDQIGTQKTQQQVIGELDFLLQSHDRSSGMRAETDPSQDLAHVELSVKFYLQDLTVHAEHPEGLDQWVGLQRADTLARKLNRLLSHQIPLAQSAAVQAYLAEQQLPSIGQSYMHLTGWLFSAFQLDDSPSHVKQQHNINAALHPEHARGIWFVNNEKYWLAWRAEVIQLLSTPDHVRQHLGWQILPNRYRMAPACLREGGDLPVSEWAEVRQAVNERLWQQQPGVLVAAFVAMPNANNKQLVWQEVARAYVLPEHDVRD